MRRISVLKGPDFDILDFFQNSFKVLSDLINPHWAFFDLTNQKNYPVRIRLISFFYRNFEISNSRIKIDIKNLFSTKRSKFCKNAIGFFFMVLAFLNLEFQWDSVFWSKSHVWREMREIGKSSVGVYQVTEYFGTIFEKI